MRELRRCVAPWVPHHCRNSRNRLTQNVAQREVNVPAARWFSFKASIFRSPLIISAPTLPASLDRLV